MPDNILEPSNGLSISKISQATASASDVLSGKTFYAGDKSLKIGSMANRGSWGYTLSPGYFVTVPEGYHSGYGIVTANPAPSGVIDVLGSLNDSSSSFSKTISSEYKSFVWIHYCNYANGYLIPAAPSISSGSLTQVLYIYGLGYVWTINNVTLPFTISSQVNNPFSHQYILLLGVK